MCGTSENGKHKNKCKKQQLPPRKATRKQKLLGFVHAGFSLPLPSSESSCPMSFQYTNDESHRCRFNLRERNTTKANLQKIHCFLNLENSCFHYCQFYVFFKFIKLIKSVAQFKGTHHFTAMLFSPLTVNDLCYQNIEECLLFGSQDTRNDSLEGC